jgi:hypothetical protein
MINAKIAAVFSSIIFLVCCSTYAYSFFGPPINKLLPWTTVLFGCAFASMLLIYLIELPNLSNGRLTHQQFTRDMPRWMSKCELALGVLLAGHFIWLLKAGGGGVPATVDGQYVLESRGRVLETIAESQFLSLKDIELRLFAIAFASIYFMLAMYWWLHKSVSRPK